MSSPSHAMDASFSNTSVPLLAQDPAVTAETYSEVARLGVGEQFPAAIALTREIFGDFTIDISDDPEIRDCSYVTFNVRSNDTVDEVVIKHSERIRRLPRWPTQAVGSFCISTQFDE